MTPREAIRAAGKQLTSAFWNQVMVLDIRYSDCWIWTGRRTPNGYGTLTWQGRSRVAHRVMYQCVVGPIPEGKELDHKCRVRDCVNPMHLRPVTHKENILSGMAPSAENALKVRCPKGHEYTVCSNGKKGWQRRCIPCRNARIRERAAIKARAKAEAKATADVASKVAPRWKFRGTFERKQRASGF